MELKTKQLLTEHADKDLATKAAELLGYKQLTAHLNLAGPLGKVLLQLEIDPFRNDSVEAYKADRVKTMTEAALEAGTIRKKLTWLQRNFTCDKEETFNTKTDEGYLAYALHWNIRKYEWIRQTIDSYQGEVPLYILRKAVQIKEQRPLANFYIDEVRLKDQPQPDPFLVVEEGDERYYIEVWDEQKFRL